MDWLARTPLASSASVAALLEKRGALVAGMVGGLGIALATVLDRLFTDPNLYERATDWVVHLAAETIANALIWAVTWSVLLAVGTALRRLDGRTRRISTFWAPLLVGAMIGPLACKVVVRHSILWPTFSPAIWWVSSVVFGVVAATALRGALLLGVNRRTTRASLFLLVPALWVHFYTLHRYLWQYGNLHFLAQVCVVVLVAAVLTLVLRRVAFARALALSTALGLAMCFVVLVAASPSQSSRRAVTVWGAGVRHVLLQVAWPAIDGDDDGAPKGLWGVDPDDSNPSVTPLSVAGPEDARESKLRTLRLRDGAPRNLMFVLMDTVRLDSFERLLKTHAAVRQALASFAYYPNFMSCSSRTHGVLSQLLGDARCDLHTVEARGAHSLLELLRERGYDSELLTYFPPMVRFPRHTQVADDAKLLELALRTATTPSPARRAIFVHLQAGHAPLETIGVTPRTIYEARVVQSFAALSRFVNAMPRDDWALVLVGDHGEAFGEHTTFGHATTLYEEVLRTPLLVRAPRVVPGRSDDAMGCPDVAWLALFGLDVLETKPEPLPYQYAALDRESSRTPKRDSIRALKIGSLKAIWRPWLGTWEFYDLASDPGELRSLVDARPREFAALRSELENVSRRCERR